MNTHKLHLIIRTTETTAKSALIMYANELATEVNNTHTLTKFNRLEDKAFDIRMVEDHIFNLCIDVETDDPVAMKYIATLAKKDDGIVKVIGAIGETPTTTGSKNEILFVADTEDSENVILVRAYSMFITRNPNVKLVTGFASYPLSVGDEVVYPKVKASVPELNRHFITKIEGGKVYLDNSKSAVRIPERLIKLHPITV